MDIRSATHLSLTRRTAFRTGAIFATLMSLANLVIFVSLFVYVHAELKLNLRDHVDEVRRALVDFADTSGIAGLVPMVNRRLEIADAHEDIFLVTNSDNTYVAGNIQNLPLFEGWRFIPWDQLSLIGTNSARRSSTAIYGRWTKIAGGNLFVGDGNGDIKNVHALMVTALFWAVLATLACALIGGLILGWKAQKRIDTIDASLRAVADGKLDSRIPVSSAHDDIDQVGALVNETLRRMQILVDNVRQVSNDIAHDLRTPVGRLRHRLELAIDQKDPVSATFLQDAIRELDEISGTFDSLLRISEIEAGDRKASFANVDLSAVLATVVDALFAVAEDKDDIFLTRSPPAKVLVWGDRQLLAQMLMNIIENAIEHCPKGSVVQALLDVEDGRPVVRVLDNGPGIPPEERPLIFRRLYRMDRSRSSRGSGLGLSLVAAIAELHGAEISLQDNEPGLAFCIRFSGLAAAA